MDSNENIIGGFLSMLCGCLLAMFIVCCSQRIPIILQQLYDDETPPPLETAPDEQQDQGLNLGRRPKGKKNKRIYNTLHRMSLRRYIPSWEKYSIEQMAKRRDWQNLKAIYF